jgi:hypothetical protein
MSAPEFVRTGWACVTEAMMGAYVSLEGSTAEDATPVIFDTYDEAIAEREHYIDDVLEARAHDLDADPGELEALLEDERDSLEAEESVVFVGMDHAGDVFELDPENGAVFRRLRRPDR